MSTIYAFQESEASLTTPPGATDALVIYSASAKATRQVPAALVGEAARSVTAGTTSAAYAGFGIFLSSTLLSVNTITDPTQKGQEMTVLFPPSTAIITVAPVAATIIGSTVTAAGATKITKTGTSDGVGGSITLIAASTAQWYIKSIGGTQITTT